jgi:hypothetical protein
MVEYEEDMFFSLSETDPTFKGKNIDQVVEWLRKEKCQESKPYIFSEKTPKNGLPSGARVLFSFHGQVFGTATVKEYRSNHTVIFYLNAEIFPKPFKRRHDLRDTLLPKKKDFGQVFTYLSPSQYDEICRRCRLR